MAYPAFTGIPLHRVKLSAEVAAAWSESKLLAYGASAIVRSFDEGAFPVIKIAQPTPESRMYIQHEFELVQKRAGFDGMLRVDPEPLRDAEGIFGFRSERLFNPGFADIKAKGRDVRKVAERLHAKGYCHGDLHPSNVMLDGEGKVVLVDFAFSGPIGQPTDGHIPSWVYG